MGMTLRRNAARLLSLGALTLGVGCARSEAEEATEPMVDTDSHFAVLPVTASTSILTEIRTRLGKPRLCLGLLGFGTETDAAARTMKGIVDTTVNAWNDQLAGHPDWSIAHVDVQYAVQRTECGVTDGDFRINVWKDKTAFETDYCSRHPRWVCASAANTAQKTFFVGPVNRGVAADVFEAFTYLHEYGHLIGLGDTYRIPGSHDWVGTQPPSVMNAGSSTLTEDDKLGLWVTLREIDTGTRSCDGFGEEMTMTSNVWSTLMCGAVTVPVATHR